MRKTLGAGLLVLALVCPAFAGETHNPEPQPPPPNASENQTAEDQGDTPPTPEEMAVEAALFLLNSILTLP